MFLAELFESNSSRCIMVCQHSSCLVNGAAEVLKAFQLADLPSDVEIIPTGCLGQCSSGVTVRIIPEEIWYCRVKPDDVDSIVNKHLKEGTPIEEKLNPRIHIKFDF